MIRRFDGCHAVESSREIRMMHKARPFDVFHNPPDDGMPGSSTDVVTRRRCGQDICDCHILQSYAICCGCSENELEEIKELPYIAEIVLRI